jgi:hypothetical protein
MHRVHSLDQLNQVSFEGFGSEGLKASLALGNKYNTLPVSSVSVIRDGIMQSESKSVPKKTIQLNPVNASRLDLDQSSDKKQH